MCGVRTTLGRVLATALLAAVPLTAQQNIKWLDGDLSSGIGNAFPWGSVGVRYQAIVPGPLLGARALVQDIFVSGRPAGTDLDIEYEDIEIRMGLTAEATPIADWNANNPTPTVVYRGPLRVYMEVGAWRGLGLPKPFLFDPQPATPHLCFEVIVWKVKGQRVPANFYHPLASRTLPRAFAHDWITNRALTPTVETASGSKLGFLLDDGNFVVVGEGCPGSNSLTPLLSIPGGWPRVGQALVVQVSRAKAWVPVTLAIGTSFTTWAGLALPIDMAFMGSPGCLLWNELLVLQPAASDAQGVARVSLHVPADPVFMGARIYAFWVLADAGANGGGLTTSAGSALLIGR